MAKFENRHLYIGGSDFGSVLEVNPYKKRIDLILEKAQVIKSTFCGNEATRRGEALEQEVIKKFEDEAGLLVTDQQKEFEMELSGCCLKLLCHVDGLINEEDAVFEAKTADIKGKTWKDGIPLYYQAQLELNCFLAQKKKAYIAVAFCDGLEIKDFKYYEYEPHMTVEEIIKASSSFAHEVEKYRNLGTIDSGVIRSENIKNKILDEYFIIQEQISVLKSKLAPLEASKKIIEEKVKRQIGCDHGIEDDLYRITLGHRITAPSQDYKICRCGLKIELKEGENHGNKTV